MEKSIDWEVPLDSLNLKGNVWCIQAEADKEREDKEDSDQHLLKVTLGNQLEPDWSSQQFIFCSLRYFQHQSPSVLHSIFCTLILRAEYEDEIQPVW